MKRQIKLPLPELKKVISIFLLLTICSQYLLKAGILISWKINQTYISENLCINKDKPEMNCNGKCHLQKQLKSVEEKQDNTDKTSLPLKLKVLETDNFVSISESFIPAIAETKNLSVVSILNNLYSFDYRNTCFKPPQAAV